MPKDMLCVDSADDPVPCPKCDKAMRKHDKPKGFLRTNGALSRGAWSTAYCDDCGTSQDWSFERR